MNKKTIQKVAREVNKAYCDSNPEVPFGKTLNKRNLSFKASAADKLQDCISFTGTIR